MRVVITGANRGIGLELARLSLARGDEVVSACRVDEGTGVGEVVEGVDVTTEEGVSALESALGESAIDLLINNAGLLHRVGLGELDWESIRRQMEVNAYGPLRVTQRLLPRLRRGSKVAIVTSRMGSIADNTSGSHYGYRMSKAAVNMAGASLSRDLAPRGIAVCLLHPGYVTTRMTGFHGNWGAEDAARGLLDRIDELTLATSGGFWHAEGQRLPW
ncbi:MAG TPA: SDR family oxidoreductase [Myxococcota bacterium]|nr:SDR family oxidoreductase [Myxococcota bacterium]